MSGSARSFVDPLDRPSGARNVLLDPVRTLAAELRANSRPEYGPDVGLVVWSLSLLWVCQPNHHLCRRAQLCATELVGPFEPQAGGRHSKAGSEHPKNPR